jgi:arginase
LSELTFLQPKVGVDEGPLRLVEYGLLEQLTELGWDCEFDGHRDLSSFRPTHDPEIRKLKQPRYVARVTEAVSKAVKSHIEKGQLALTLGGDHSLAMGTVAGTFAVHPDAVLIWIDAHADINTPETTASGNIHGCPVAFLMGLAGHVPGFEWLKPCLRPDRIVYIGLRDIDPPEKKILRTLGIKAFSMHEVDKYGIGKVMDMALDHVNPNRDRPIHLSFDVDALDPTVAPSTGESVAMTAWEGNTGCDTLKRRSESRDLVPTVVIDDRHPRSWRFDVPRRPLHLRIHPRDWPPRSGRFNGGKSHYFGRGQHL